MENGFWCQKIFFLEEIILNINQLKIVDKDGLIILIQDYVKIGHLKKIYLCYKMSKNKAKNGHLFQEN